MNRELTTRWMNQNRHHGGNGNEAMRQCTHSTTQSFAIVREDTYQVEVEDGINLSELERVVERGNVAQPHADGHGAKRGDKQRPRRIALDEGNTLRAQKVHNESLPQDVNQKEVTSCLPPIFLLDTLFSTSIQTEVSGLNQVVNHSYEKKKERINICTLPPQNLSFF